MNKQTRFQKTLVKAEKLFLRKNYLLALKEFETARRLSPDNNLTDKIKQCYELSAPQRRAELLKNARKSEKKNKLSVALNYFDQAMAIEHEDWLDKKIKQLHLKLQQTDTASAINSNDKTASLEKEVSLLLTSGQFVKTLAIFNKQAPVTHQGIYDYGFALMQTQNYQQALLLWLPLINQHDNLSQQIILLLPAVKQQLTSNNESYKNIYLALKALQSKPGEIDEYLNYFTACYVKELWDQENYLQILEIVSPLASPLERIAAEPVSSAWLDLFAKLYFQLAASDAKFVDQAINYWLTNIYNHSGLNSLPCNQPPIQSPTQPIIDIMDKMLNQHLRQNSIDPSVLDYWKKEQQQTLLLSTLSLAENTLPVFPCSPGFASHASLSEQILNLLMDNKETIKLSDNEFIEIAAQYSKYSSYLNHIEPGQEAQIFKNLPGYNKDPIAAYCVQYIALQCGINLVLAGNRNHARYFNQVKPLVLSNPSLLDKLITLSNDPYLMADNIISSLTEAMNNLGRFISTTTFKKAWSQILIKNVNHQLLGNTNLNPARFESRVQKALKLDPDSEPGRQLLHEIHLGQYCEKIDKAFKHMNLFKAAKIAADSGVDEIADYFFSDIDALLMMIQNHNQHEQRWMLRDCHQACHFLDKNHPCTQLVSSALENLKDT